MLNQSQENNFPSDASTPTIQEIEKAIRDLRMTNKCQSVIKELASITEGLKKFDTNQEIFVERVQDLAKGASLVLHHFTPEQASEVCRYLAPLIECSRLSTVRSELLDLSVIAVRARSNITDSNDTSLSDFITRSACHLTDTTAKIAEKELQSVCDDPFLYYVSSQAAKHIACAIALTSKHQLSTGLVKHTPFEVGCELIAKNAFEDECCAVLVAKVLFNSLYSRLMKDPNCEHALADRDYFLKRFSLLFGDEMPFICNQTTTELLIEMAASIRLLKDVEVSVTIDPIAYIEINRQADGLYGDNDQPLLALCNLTY